MGGDDDDDDDDDGGGEAADIQVYPGINCGCAGSTISTLLHDRINPKDCQVLSLGDTGFLQFFRVVSRDYGKPRCVTGIIKMSGMFGDCLFDRLVYWHCHGEWC